MAAPSDGEEPAHAHARAARDRDPVRRPGPHVGSGLPLLLTLSARCGTDQGARSRTTWFRVDYPQHG